MIGATLLRIHPSGKAGLLSAVIGGTIRSFLQWGAALYRRQIRGLSERNLGLTNLLRCAVFQSVPCARGSVGERHRPIRRVGRGGGREGRWSRSSITFHIKHIVTGYYKLHVLHVFTVDSLHSVQTLGRAEYLQSIPQ